MHERLELFLRCLCLFLCNVLVLCLRSSQPINPPTRRAAPARCLWATASSASEADDGLNSVAQSKKSPTSFRPASQQRRKPKQRRPKYYWTDIENVETELREFWMNLGVEDVAVRGAEGNTISTLTIPNESLLNHFGRHDLRAAIATHGGREELAAELPWGAKIIPGKWAEAVATSPELQILLQNKSLGLSRDVPPGIKRLNSSTKSQNTEVDTARLWSHKSDRKPKGYWTQQKVITELCDYLDNYSSQFGRPAIWMPRPKELTKNGRYDLKCAMDRFGGSKRIAKLAGLVPFREWNYFEGQYELLVLLKNYIDEYHSEKEGWLYSKSWRYQIFPNVSEIKSNGNDRLYQLIQYYGGRNFLSSRLGMTKKSYSERSQSGISWGDFSIEFAIRLSELIRRDHMQVKPPIANPVICMPTEKRLQYAGEEGAWLHEKILEFGGYENVARRLYLGYRFR